MRWNFGMALFVILAAGYVVLGMYGKYRKLMEDFHEARAERAARIGDMTEGRHPENS